MSKGNYFNPFNYRYSSIFKHLLREGSQALFEPDVALCEDWRVP